MVRLLGRLDVIEEVPVDQGLARRRDGRGHQGVST